MALFHHSVLTTDARRMKAAGLLLKCTATNRFTKGLQFMAMASAPGWILKQYQRRYMEPCNMTTGYAKDEVHLQIAGRKQGFMGTLIALGTVDEIKSPSPSYQVSTSRSGNCSATWLIGLYRDSIGLWGLHCAV